MLLQTAQCFRAEVHAYTLLASLPRMLDIRCARRTAGIWNVSLLAAREVLRKLPRQRFQSAFSAESPFRRELVPGMEQKVRGPYPAFRASGAA
jgi:hypothetical protein